MPLSDQRWKSITPSAYSWEQDALTYIRERLPDLDPYRAWSNFEFIANDGTINEVDLLVLTPVGFFLVEIKSWPGMLKGDLMTWIVEHEGRLHTHDNTLFLANRKSKKLATLLRSQKGAREIRVPFIEPLVFLSHESVRCHLPEGSRTRVTVRDRENAGPAYPSGIIGALTKRAFEGSTDTPHSRIDRPVAKAIAMAVEQAGIRESNRSRRVGDYVLKELLFDAPNGVYQDWLGEHVQSKEARRVRIYTVSRASSEEDRELTKRAANREYQILSALVHAAMPQVETPIQHELGTALLFRIRKNAIRLDHLLAEKGDSLSIDVRLVLVRALAEAMKYAHEKKIFHRALSPQSVFVTNYDTPSPQIQIFNWQASYREGSLSGASRVSATRHIEDLVEAASMAYVAPESMSDPDASGEKLDAFSLGAISYFIFSGNAPATSPLELIEKIREGPGLRISAVLDGAGEAMQELVQLSTHPDTMLRPDSVDDFLKLLDAVEDELTTPTDEDEVANPLDAQWGNKLPGGFKVKRRLGKGSSATAFLVEKDKREVVLKLANGPEKNDRIRAEAETLKKLSHPNIAQFFENVMFDKSNLAGFTMEYAGERDPDKNQRDLDASLADRLRKEGALQLELLENLGADLIEAVRYLEQKGIAHRDIKPENAGVGVGSRKDRTRLVLYDFSLSRAPLTEIHAGTPPY
ncbi:MAG TPA: protein kinase, partial [Thermoanaerobaculia bacterium]